MIDRKLRNGIKNNYKTKVKTQNKLRCHSFQHGNTHGQSLVEQRGRFGFTKIFNDIILSTPNKVYF
jgi:hypothetical protein